MDKIFSLDITSSPISAIVLEDHGDQLSLIETVDIDLQDQDFFEKLSNEEFHELITDGSGEDQEDETYEHVTSDQVEDVKAELQPVVDLYNQHSNELVSSIVVARPCSYLSLNLDLPFGKDNLIEKVIDLEVQDLIPFDVNKFVVDHHLIDELEGGSYDVHAAMLPKNYVQRLLSFCRDLNIDPEFITTPSAALGGIADVADNQIVLSLEKDRIYTNSVIDGKVRSAQVVEVEEKEEFPFASIKMLINYVNSRYQKEIDQITLIGNSISPELLSEKLDMEVKSLDVDLAKDSEQYVTPWLAANSIANVDSNRLLCNFRSGPYAYRPWGSASISLMAKLWPYFLTILVLLLMLPIVIYYQREIAIGDFQEAIRSNIRSQIPQLELETGNELNSLMNASGAIQAQLDNLGSAERSNPLEVYLILSELLGEAAKANFQMDLIEVEIRGDRAEVSGTVSKYAGVDQIEKILKKRGDVFCEIEADTPGGSSVNVRFNFEIRLC